MFTIGVTGQTGAGKSTLAKYLEKYGFVHIDTDKIAKDVIGTKTKELCVAFGNDILSTSGEINRKLLAKKAFSNGAETQKLNSIMHPAIMEEVEKEIERLKTNNVTGAVIDGAALIESGYINKFDTSVCVCAEDDVRKKRIISRDNLSDSDANIRMRGQMRREFYIINTVYLINNNTDEELKNGADSLMKKYNFKKIKE